MITIPLYIFLIIYLVLFLALISFFAVNISHLIHTGSATFTSFVVTVVVIVSIILIIWFTWYLLADMNWSYPVVLFDNEWLNNFFIF